MVGDIQAFFIFFYLFLFFIFFKDISKPLFQLIRSFTKIIKLDHVKFPPSI